MRKMIISLAALAVAAAPLPAFAQQSSMKDGPYWTAGRIAVEDGQMENYKDFLVKVWAANQEYAKSQGWLLDYHVLESVNPRDGEPNIILITSFADMPSAAEAERRSNILNQRMNQDDRSAAAASGQRGTMRKLMGSVLYREQLKR